MAVRLSLSLVALLAATGCSHPLEIIGDGDIISSSGEHDCLLAEQPCTNYVTGDYVVTYTALPHAGAEFLRWEGCNSDTPECSFDVPGSIVDQYWFQTAPALRAIFSDKAPGTPQERHEVTGYVMGHSLWQHGTLEHHTGEWLARFASHANKTSTWTGRFGQLDQHAARLPITLHNEQDAAFGYPSSSPVVDAWAPGTQWQSAGFDHVVTMPWNFAQTDVAFDQRPDPLSHVLAIVDFWGEAAPEARSLIFEHWPETSMVPGVPGSRNLTDEQWRRYWRFTREQYHAWFTGFQDAINTARPALNVEMIPVGPVLADLFLNTPYLDSLPSAEFFEDDAPHGTPGLYFLSALVWYRQLYGVSVESTFMIPATSPSPIPSAISDNFALIIDFIDARVAYYNSNR